LRQSRQSVHASPPRYKCGSHRSNLAVRALSKGSCSAFGLPSPTTVRGPPRPRRSKLHHALHAAPSLRLRSIKLSPCRRTPGGHVPPRRASYLAGAPQSQRRNALYLSGIDPFEGLPDVTCTPLHISIRIVAPAASPPRPPARHSRSACPKPISPPRVGTCFAHELGHVATIGPQFAYHHLPRRGPASPAAPMIHERLVLPPVPAGPKTDEICG